MDKKLVEALRAYLKAGFGSLTDFDLQGEAYLLAIDAIAEFEKEEAKAIDEVVPYGFLPFTGKLHEIGLRWIKYAQNTQDVNDIALAVWSAMKESLDVKKQAGEAVGVVRHVQCGVVAQKSYRHEVQLFEPAPKMPDGTLLYTSLPAQVPDGWQLVPKEPTSEMLKAIDQHGEYYSEESLKDAYMDMLAAAPQTKWGEHD